MNMNSSHELIMKMEMELLPEDCVAHVLSLMCPREACRFSVISPTFCAALGSEILWETFLPSDYKKIISGSVSPITFTSKKELFLKLVSGPLLINGGSMAFSIDKRTGKKCYMLSARELSITWANNPLFWCWKPVLESRFSEVVELIMVWWLEIHGKINTRILSPNMTYAAFFVFKISDRAFGLDSIPSEVSIEEGQSQSKVTTYLRRCCTSKRRSLGSMHYRVQERVALEREDGWLEIELGEFYNEGSDDREVKMCLREINGQHLKGGLVVEGIEIRPKSRSPGSMGALTLGAFV